LSRSCLVASLPEEIVSRLDVTDLHMHYDKRAVGAPAHI
jgi:hypothetical protein